MACAVAFLSPRVALGAEVTESPYSSYWNDSTKTYTVTGDQGYPGKRSLPQQVSLPDGATLDLSEANDYTSSDYTIAVLFRAQGDLTIIGPAERALSFSEDLVSFLDTRSQSDCTLTLKNMRFAQTGANNEQTLDLYRVGQLVEGDSTVKVVYSGACALPRISVGSIAQLTFSPAYDAPETSCLELYDVSPVSGQTNADRGSFTFDGGRYVISHFLSAKSIILKDCTLTSGNEFMYLIVDPTDGKLSITDSTVDVEFTTDAPGSPNYAVLGGYVAPGAFPVDSLTELCGEDASSKVLIDDSRVTVTVADDNRSGIGGVKDVEITNGSQVNVGVNDTLDANADNMNTYSAGIGGLFRSITIRDSVVESNAAGGAGIGAGHPGVDDEDTLTAEQLAAVAGYITIEDSTVTATSVDGAGIGSADLYRPVTPANYPPNVPQPLTITIKGESDVKAYSLNAAAIGGGPDEITIERPGGLEVSTGPIGGWTPVEGSSGDATRTLAAAAAVTSPAAAQPEVLLAPRNGGTPIESSGISEDVLTYVDPTDMTLVVEKNDEGDTLSIFAESGVCAIACENVRAGDVTIVQNTLSEDPDQTTAIRLGTDVSTSVPLGEQRPNFTSLASTVTVAQGESYQLYYGGGDNPAPLLNTNDAAGALTAGPYKIAPGLNMFWTKPDAHEPSEAEVTAGEILAALDYERECFDAAKLPTGVTLYTDADCTQQIDNPTKTDALTSYISGEKRSLYAKVEGSTAEQPIHIELPARPGATSMTDETVIPAKTSLTIHGTSGVVYNYVKGTTGTPSTSSSSRARGSTRASLSASGSTRSTRSGATWSPAARRSR